MQREPVEAEGIVSIGYDFPTFTLEVEFRGDPELPGSIYQFSNIPQALYNELMEVPDKDGFLHDYVTQHFKEYPSRKIQP